MNYTPSHTLTGHTSAVYSLIHAAEAGKFYAGASDGLVSLWDAEAGESLPFLVKVGKPVFSLCLNEAHLLIGQNEGGMHVIDLGSRKELRLLKYHERGIFAMERIGTEKLLLSAGGDGRLCVMDMDDYRLVHTIQLSAMKLRCIAVSRDESYTLVGSSDGSLTLLDSRYFNELQRIKGHEGGVYCIKQLNDDTWISGGRDAHLRIWRKQGDSLLQSEAIPAHNFAIYSLALSQHGGRIATASRDKSVKVWDTADLNSPQRLSLKQGAGHSHSVNAVLISPTGDRVISAGDDRKIMVWEANPAT